MAVNASNIFVGVPDQAATGAILSGAAQATAPTDIDSFDFSSAVDSGYISEDGVSISPTDTTTSIKDWSGAEVRSILTEFTGEITWTHLELNAAAARNYFGDDQVTLTSATDSSGTQMVAGLGKTVLPTKSWYFKIKDGDRRALVYVPNGQVSKRGDIPFSSSAAITLPITLSTYPDAAGLNIYIYTDDGVFSASTPPSS